MFFFSFSQQKQTYSVMTCRKLLVSFRHWGGDWYTEWETELARACVRQWSAVTKISKFCNARPWYWLVMTPTLSCKWLKHVILVSSWSMGTSDAIFCIPRRLFSPNFGILNVCFFCISTFVVCIRKHFECLLPLGSELLVFLYRT